MKKILTVVIGGMIISCTVAGRAAGQATEKSVAYVPVKNNTEKGIFGDNSTGELKVAETSVKASKANLKAMKATFRATETFKKGFKDIPDAKWSVGEFTMVAYFTKDGLNSEVVFNKAGNLLHCLTMYSADKTPKDIRSVVEEDYPNADINSCMQINENGNTFYVVQMEDKRTYKEVSVYNGQTELLKEFKKTN